MRTALAALLLATLWSAPAWGDVYAGERPAGPQAQAVAVQASEFWAARNVVACPEGVELLQAPDLSGGDGDAMGRGGDCVAWISDDEAADLEARAPYAAGLRVGCAVVFHEVGHALGLPHSESGVMGVVPSFPWECRTWTYHRLKETRRARGVRMR